MSISNDEDFSKSITIRGVKYTAEICLRELVALKQQFPAKNISRDFFRQNTTVPEAAWAKFFGQFAEFQRQAGLKTTRTESKFINSVAKSASLDKVRETSESRKNYAGKYIRDSGRRIKTLVGLSDLHDEECDPFLIRVAIETIKKIKPDVICLAGDIFDCPEFGKYPVDPREWNPVRRLKAGLDIVRRLREAAPEAQIDLIEGNHEARLLRYLTENAPAFQVLMSDLHGWDLAKLFGLDKYRVNYIAKSDLATFTDRQRDLDAHQQNHAVYWGAMLVHHDPVGSKLGMPGFNGHHHKHKVDSYYNVHSGAYQWHQLGGGHVRRASYCMGEKWNTGFMVSHVDTVSKEVIMNYADVGLRFAEVGGEFFRRDPDEVYLGFKDALGGKELCLIKK